MRLSSANINVMTKACFKASKVLIRDFGEIENLQVSMKGPGDFVTASDKKVEKILIEELQKARPDYEILSEESGKIGKKNSEFRWIIDPIDGTTNYLHGIPHFAISIGLEKKDEIICGIIFDPIKNEFFTAEKGNGSYMNNRRIRVSSRSILKEAMIFCGGPKFKTKNKDIVHKEYSKISKEVFTSPRKMGSAALNMAYVAAGRCDGYFERNLSYWDIAAGIIIVEEAGGHVTDFYEKNNYLSNKTLIVGNSKIHRELVKILS